MFKGTHKWLPHKMDINIEIHLSCKYMDITREILIKKKNHQIILALQEANNIRSL